LALTLCALIIVPANALIVGSFETERMYGPYYNLLTGEGTTTIRSDLYARGHEILLGNRLTSDYLAKIDIFVTGFLGIGDWLSDEEQNALRDWVMEGGVLISTGECT